ncbi:type II secretion system F family protein [Gilvimarinus sp. SDUM040013]|uniref:Type II secretion system F family protein n=1 Tax=Gilvimarinus gilvus TaxID=3058038 RepID=A0ABU4RYB7_9GAMM|nr:type II secretion system F family protein [Gilvimarinus sp. SDUM040013]MDO3385248.1 type II secretion system F family protein [Gilvimarinus sp. SDUM040013]MDX6849231.1 type II secretion system F family protein [Gilvimarinus sp. SDUM040013]
MPGYSYKAAKRDGSLVEGSLDAGTEDLAARELRSQGLVVLSLSGGVQSAAVRSRGGGFGQKQVLSFTSELAVLLRAGLPIDKALKVLLDMSTHDNVRTVLTGVLNTVKSGKGFSQALAEHPAQFDEFYISMVRSGEASGNLAQVLNRLSEQLERIKEVRSGVVSAMIYPAILAVVALISVLVMLGFVVPQFDALFSDMGESLPLLTEMVIAGGEAIKNNGIWIVLFSGLFIYALRRWLRTEPGRNWLDNFLLKLPVLGGVVFKYEVARFSRTMGTLLSSGVSLLQSLKIAVGTVGNVHVHSALAALAPEVKKGGRISKALIEADMFSPLMIQMVRVGEESGQLDEMLLELAKVYDDEVSSGIKRSLTLLEPILILTMGGMIGFIIVAILMGILSVNDLAV